MKRQPVQSSNIAEIRFAPEDSVLEILFRDGSLYHYFGVPSTVHDGLIETAAKGGSVGRYHHQHVKLAGFRYERVWDR